MDALAIEYSDSDGKLTNRIISQIEGGGWGILAYCHNRQESRNFALDRIISAVDLETNTKIENIALFLENDTRSKQQLWQLNPDDVTIDMPKRVKYERRLDDKQYEYILSFGLFREDDVDNLGAKSVKTFITKLEAEHKLKRISER